MFLLQDFIQFYLLALSSFECYLMVLTIVFSTSFRKCINFVILFFSLVITLNFSYFLVFSYFGNFFIFYTLFRI